jgi:nitroimidazol reductase NimA-like FMN-containing flavoprotein (pyridoxamine 5'-phosphate oxidase superfamily)
MLIAPMTRSRSLELLDALRIGRLGCSRGAQPYVTPFAFARHAEHLYSFATLGRKIAWMRDNPRVCVEADRIVNRSDWQSLVIFGRYEELPATAEFLERQEFAHALLSRGADWWDPGYTKTVDAAGAERPLVPVYFRISVDEISGHCCTPG